MKALFRTVLFGWAILFVSHLGVAALSRQNNILGKFTVVNVTGTVTCITNGRIIELKKGDTIKARGTFIETSPHSKVSLVFSNQTSVVVDEKTRLEIVKFDQEFFAPNNNLRVEPSNSSTIVKLNLGRVVISTPRLLSGTTMVYETAHAMVGIRGDRILIEAEEKQTHVAMISGNATVNPRGPDGQFVSIGRRLITGQEAFVKYTLGGNAIAEDGLIASENDAAPAASSPLAAAPIVDTGAIVAGPTHAPMIRDSEATVLKIVGSATAKLPAEAAERAITEDAKLPKGTIITTDDSSELFLQPYEGAIATLRPNTVVQIEKLAITTNGGVITKQTALLALKAGTVVSNIDPAKHEINDYGIRTPKGIASANGTSFSVSVEDDGFFVATTADTVTFVTPEGVSYAINAGNVTITPPGGEPQAPISLAAAVASSSGFAEVVQTALNTVATVVQSNLGGLSSTSATDLITKVANTASAALPAQATAIATKAIAAVTWPSAATSSEVSTAVAAVTSAIVAGAPDQAAQIATSAALAAPNQAVAAAAGAAKSAPTQAAQIASAVTQTFVQTTPQGNVSPASVQTATAVAAAVTASVPEQAAPVAAAVMQALAQAAPLASPIANSQTAATIASAVTAAAPSQAVPVAATMMKVLTMTPTFAEASPQQVAQTAGILASAVTTVVPPQAQEVATAVMQLLVQTYPNASPAATAQTAGVLAAAVSQAAPSQAAAVMQGVAIAANQPLVSVQASAAQAGPVVAQISQQVGQITQAANAASQQSNAVINGINQSGGNSGSLAGNTNTPAPSGSTGSPSVPGANTGAGGSNSGTGGDAAGETTNTSTSIIVTQFDPNALGELTADLEAAHAAQTTVHFSTETGGGSGSGTNNNPIFNPGGGGGDDDEPTVQPKPVIPSNTPVENTASVANNNA